MNEIIQKPWGAIQNVLRDMDLDDKSPSGLRGWKEYRPLNVKKPKDGDEKKRKYMRWSV
jgi:hypothetical protein